MTNNSIHIRILALVVMLIALGSSGVSAQVEVAPTRVIMSMRERSQEVNVTNPTDDVVEVTTDLGFKVIRYDSLGTITLDSARTPYESSVAGDGWLKIFPRRFTLAPRASRTVRVMVTVPDSAPEGEFWARLMVAGTPINASIKVDDDAMPGIETSLKMRMELDMPVIIRKGNVATGVAFNSAEIKQIDGRSLLLVDMNRTGNSAYRGTLNAVIRDSGGNEIQRASEQFTVEFTLRKAIVLPTIADGEYTLDLESISVKKGSANDAVIQAPTVTQRYTLSVRGADVRLKLD